MTIRKILIAVAAAVFLFSGFMVLRYYLQTDSSGDYTEEIAQMAVTYTETKPTDAVEQNKTPSHGEEEIAEAAPIKVDFDSLLAVNQDVVAWLYCPDTPINYPIVQAQDNAYYLKRRLDGKSDFYGTLFMDYRNASDDWNRIVYGHNMYSEAMFGTLTKYQKQDYFDAHPVMYLITPNQSYKIQIFAGFTTSEDADLYRALNPNEKEKIICIEAWLKDSDIVSGIKPTASDRIITLSTCSYESDDARYVLVGILQALANG